MKKDLHPKTRLVVFKDISNGFQLITESTVESNKSISIDGKDMPLVSFDVSSSSHPFYTGKQRLLDIEGRAERFVKKYQGFTTLKKNPVAKEETTKKTDSNIKNNLKAKEEEIKKTDSNIKKNPAAKKEATKKTDSK